MDKRNIIYFNDMSKKEIIELFKSVYQETIPSFLMSPNAKYIKQIINRLSILTEEQLLQQFYPIMGNDDLFRLFLEEETYIKLLTEIDCLTVQKKHKNNYTLLMALIANPKICKFDKKIVIDVLLDRGEYIDQLTDDGDTALTLAIRKNDTYLVEYLLEKGAKINSVPDNYGILATHITAFNKNLYLTSLLNYYNGSTVCPIPDINISCQELAEIVDDKAMLSLLREIENKYVTHKEMMEL